MTSTAIRPSPQTMLARATDMIPELRARAHDAEAARRLPEATIQALHDTGLWRVW